MKTIKESVTKCRCIFIDLHNYSLCCCSVSKSRCPLSPVKYSAYLECFISCATTWNNSLVIGWTEKHSTTAINMKTWVKLGEQPAFFLFICLFKFFKKIIFIWTHSLLLKNTTTVVRFVVHSFLVSNFSAYFCAVKKTFGYTFHSKYIFCSIDLKNQSDIAQDNMIVVNGVPLQWSLALKHYSGGIRLWRWNRI